MLLGVISLLNIGYICIFYYSDSALHRHQWNAKLDEIFKKNNLGDGHNQKIMMIYIAW